MIKFKPKTERNTKLDCIIKIYSLTGVKIRNQQMRMILKKLLTLMTGCFSLLESDRDLGMPLFSTSFASISSRVSSTGVLYQAVVDFDEVNVTNVSTVEDNTLTGTS